MLSSTSRRRRTRRLAGVAAVAAIAVVIAGCSSTKPDSSGAATSAPLPGITATTVKVGFTIVDLGKLAQQLGFKQANYGGVAAETKAIQAAVDYINKNGGMGGRQVDAEIKTYLGSTDSPAQSQAQCSSYTQDSKVFAVVLDGGLQNNAVPCYAAANTLVLDETLIAHDQGQFEKNSPYLWSPTHPEYSAFLKTQLTAMKNAGFFDGNSGVLLMPSDDEVSRRATSSIVQPFLAANGITKSQVSYVDSTNTGTLGATSSAALTAGKNAKLNRVLVIGGARIEPVVLSDQAANGYDSKWGISTYDNPTFIQSNGDSIVANLRNGMTGLGYSPSQDLVGSTGGPAFPDTTNPFQQKCYDTVTAAGGTPPDNLRSNWKMAFEYCDGAFFLKAVLDKVPGAATVTGQQFKDAAGKITSTDYRSSMTFGASWGPNVYAGTNAGQTMQWNSSTSTFEYTGSPVTFGPVSGAPSSVAPTTAPSVASSVGTTPSVAPTTQSTVGTVPSTPASSSAAVDPLETITAYGTP